MNDGIVLLLIDVEAGNACCACLTQFLHLFSCSCCSLGALCITTLIVLLLTETFFSLFITLTDVFVLGKIFLSNVIYFMRMALLFQMLQATYSIVATY